PTPPPFTLFPYTTLFRSRGAGERDVRAPHHQVGGVPPVPRLRHVGLVAEDLRGGRGQIRVPVVEGQHRAADELVETGAGGEGDLAHRRDRREAGGAVRAVLLDRVHVGGGDQLDRLVPGGAHQAALAAGPLVAHGLLRIGDDRLPRLDRILAGGLGLLLAEHAQQLRAHVGVAHPGGRVRVPGEGGAAGAAARLVLGLVRPGGGVVRLLRLPGDHPVLDVHLPGARAGAVHAVGGAHHLVVAPALAVEGVAAAAAHLVRLAVVLADPLRAGEHPARPDERVEQRGVDPGRSGALGGGLGAAARGRVTVLDGHGSSSWRTAG